MRLFRVLCAILLLGSAACFQPLGPLDRGGVSVAATGSALRLTNQTQQPVFYAAFERGYLALILWAPCDDPEQCSRVEPGQTISIDYNSIGGYEPGAREAVVYWWHLIQKADGSFAPDNPNCDRRAMTTARLPRAGGP